MKINLIMTILTIANIVMSTMTVAMRVTTEVVPRIALRMTDITIFRV